MDTEPEIRLALGRYRLSGIARLLPMLGPLLVLASTTTAFVGGTLRVAQIVLFGLSALTIALIWTMPATVVTDTGFRRGFRFTSWSDVAAVFPPGPGDPYVLVGLWNNKKISLTGVPQNRLRGITALAGRAVPTDTP